MTRKQLEKILNALVEKYLDNLEWNNFEALNEVKKEIERIEKELSKIDPTLLEK